MKSLMKIIFLFSLLVNSAHAKEIIFDLSAQDFQNSLGDRQLTSKYNLNDKMIIQTNLLKHDLGFYGTGSHVIGRLKIATNQALFDWKLNLDVQYEGSEKKNRFLKFTDENGAVMLFEFNSKGFVFNSKDYKANLDKKHLLIQIIKTDQEVKLLLNKQLIETQKIDFEHLKSIETTFYKFSVYEQDRLNNILLVSND